MYIPKIKYQNTECPYFPCHSLDTEEFTCKFCFCPLYLLEECGGNYKTISLVIKGVTCTVKDCSDCTKVHDSDAEEFVSERIDEVMILQNNFLRR